MAVAGAAEASAAVASTADAGASIAGSKRGRAAKGERLEGWKLLVHDLADCGLDTSAAAKAKYDDMKVVRCLACPNLSMLTRFPT